MTTAAMTAAPTIEPSDVSAEWLAARFFPSGRSAADQFTAAPEHAVEDLRSKIAEMVNADNAAFLMLAASAIHADALMGRFRGNQWHYACAATVAYDEANMRAGAECDRHNLYARAHQRAMIDEGHEPGPLADCACEPDPTRTVVPA